MTPLSRKITFSAAATAIAVLCAVATVFLPVKIVPLLVASLCFYIAFDRGGLPFGFVSIAATLLLTFFIGGGLTVTFLFLGIVFAPYGVLAFFMRKLSYRKVRHALIRVAAVAVFTNLALVAVYYSLKGLVLSAGDFDLMAVVSKLGGYLVFALIATVLFISFDFLFTQLALTVLKNLPGAKKSKKSPPAAPRPDPFSERNGSSSGQNEEAAAPEKEGTGQKGDEPPDKQGEGDPPGPDGSDARNPDDA